ncbi:major pollen allergen Lol p 11-like [Dioscorea cayenensis subsp. rotundata]|uniref:Major pollen allergen Lol p 11-like n=1 Tax=Dioscorea cayennensis subsp. rotundata TaxID=55577 RepID=A0AB40CLX3_DIOCR|nr:major pollen allergen Lol p 11-like [Dioscorea cayenensis subsp. rotundata]
MAKFQLLATLCLLSAIAAIALASPKPQFTIQGRVYCDTCRAGFETTATEYIKGAKVKMECKRYDNDEVSYEAEAVTDGSGTYSITINNDHQDEICEVVLLESPLAGCNEIVVGRNRARVVLTQNSGMSSGVRYANSLGFYKEDPLPLCGELLQMFALDD